MSIVVVFLLTVLLFVQRGAISSSLGWALIGGGLAVAVVGFLDDHFRIPARLRLLIHFAAAGWALWQLNGMGPLHLGWIIWDWGWVGQLLALVGLVWMINLYNFMDGIDGLAGVEAVCASALGGLLLAWSGLGRPCGGRTGACRQPALVFWCGTGHRPRFSWVTWAVGSWDLCSAFWLFRAPKNGRGCSGPG